MVAKDIIEKLNRFKTCLIIGSGRNCVLSFSGNLLCLSLNNQISHLPDELLDLVARFNQQLINAEDIINYAYDNGLITQP